MASAPEATCGSPHPKYPTLSSAGCVLAPGHEGDHRERYGFTWPEPDAAAVATPWELSSPSRSQTPALHIGLEHLAQTLFWYRAVLQAVGRASAFSTMAALPHIVPTDEGVVCFCQAKRRDHGHRADLVLVMTTHRLLLVSEDIEPISAGSRALLVDEPASPITEAFALDDLRLTEWATTPGPLHRNSLCASTSMLVRQRATLTLRDVFPISQAGRIAARLGTAAKPSALLGALPTDPGHPPIALMGGLALYKDRLIDNGSQQLPFGGEVKATVDTAGNIAVTRGRNLAAKGAGTLLLGPIGLLAAGNAKQHVIDTRQAFLLIEGPGWAYAHPFPPGALTLLHRFAQLVNATAHAFWSPSQSEPEDQISADPVSQLRELARLRDEGVVTDDEFAVAKARLLDALQPGRRGDQ